MAEQSVRLTVGLPVKAFGVTQVKVVAEDEGTGWRLEQWATLSDQELRRFGGDMAEMWRREISLTCGQVVAAWLAR